MAAPEPWRGNWYAFKVGSVGVVSLNNDDICYQHGGFSAFRAATTSPSANHDDYINSYSAGAQRAWLAATLADLRADREIDWIVVCMHQVAMSSANFNGADLGVREQWLPLFDRYGVDLVLAGTNTTTNGPTRCLAQTPTTRPPTGKLLLTPLAQPSPSDKVIDTTKGTVHMILGGGGHSSATPPASFDDPTQGVVSYDVGPPAGGSRSFLKVPDEPSDWSAHRDMMNEYGFGVFDLDPGVPGGKTTITFTYYGTTLGSPMYRALDSITLVRPRTDGHKKQR